MAGFKKKVKQLQEPKGSQVSQVNSPDRYYSQHPAWNFSSCDKDSWSLDAKKQNHSIDVGALNKIAIERLVKLYIEAEALISLRLTGTHRIYGYMKGAVFNILWVDLGHGDNATCVCRSRKKHT